MKPITLLNLLALLLATAIPLRAAQPDATPPDETTVLAQRLELLKSQRRVFTIQLPKPPKERHPYLFFRVAAKADKAAGYCTSAIQVLINDQPVDSQRLSNRPRTATMASGHVQTIAQGGGYFLIPWGPDFTATDHDPNYRLVDQPHACEYELHLGGLLREGPNTITLVNTNSAGLGYVLLLGDVEFRIGARSPDSQLFQPAPTGPLPVIVPKTTFSKVYSNVQNAGAKLTLAVHGRSYTIHSRFSTPDGGWSTADNPYFEHRRELIQHDEWIELRDHFVNKTSQNLPIIQEHSCPLGNAATGVWLAGTRMPTRSGSQVDGANPSAYAATRDGGLGLVALNDEFRVHATMTARDGSITLSDPSFVLAPKTSYTAELAIVPVADPDFYSFTNAARRMLDVNFTLDLCFAFMFHSEPVYQWSDERFKSFIENKSANFVVKSIYGVLTAQGQPARSTDWIAGPHTVYRDWLKRVRKFYPDLSVKTGIYFHCFLDTHEPNKKRFAADRALDAAGKQIEYGQGENSYMSLFVPTLEPGHWGSEIARVLDVILDDIGVDGVFWDEFAWSATPWIYSHTDGCSADIDPKTHRIVRLKGSMSLLSRDFRLKQVERIRQHQAPLIVNGAPWTRTLSRLQIPAFTETGSISHCSHMLLYSPIALGDHLTERSQRDAYRVMLAALDYGCLYAWYGSEFPPEYKTLTDHMYPTTPIELGRGHVIGHERILTNHSGLFGWDDASLFQAYVYDRDGRPAQEHPVKKVLRDGKTYAEVRIPGGYSAAIVRIAPR